MMFMAYHSIEIMIRRLLDQAVQLRMESGGGVGQRSDCGED
jgi:hypothetical protein